MSWEFIAREWKPFLFLWQRRKVNRYWRGGHWDTHYEYRWRFFNEQR